MASFAALFLILSWDYNPTAALFPRWVAAASVLLVVTSVGTQVFREPKTRPQEYDEDFPQPGPGAMPWPGVLALQGGYILAIYLLGFTEATLLYLIVGPIQMHYRRWGIIAAQALFLTIIISGSFIWFFHIRLPKGILWNLW